MTDRQGYVNTTKVLFRPIKRLKLIGTPEVSGEVREFLFGVFK